MNLKIHLPIIALCGLTFLVSFAAGLWWEIAQQDEWDTPQYSSSAKDVISTVAKRQTNTEKSKSDQEGKSDTEEENVASDENNEPDAPSEDSEPSPTKVTSEPGVESNVPSAAGPGRGRRGRDGRRFDINNMPPEVRARMEARRAAMETRARVRELQSTVEISDISIPGNIDEMPVEGEVIIEPDN